MHQYFEIALCFAELKICKNQIFVSGFHNKQEREAPICMTRALPKRINYYLTTTEPSRRKLVTASKSSYNKLVPKAPARNDARKQFFFHQARYSLHAKLTLTIHFLYIQLWPFFIYNSYLYSEILSSHIQIQIRCIRYNHCIVRVSSAKTPLIIVFEAMYSGDLQWGPTVWTCWVLEWNHTKSVFHPTP